jgi:hypothetical protein
MHGLMREDRREPVLYSTSSSCVRRVNSGVVPHRVFVRFHLARVRAIRPAHALWARLLASAARSLLASVPVKARSGHSKPSFAASACGSPGHRHNATVTGFHSASLRCNVGTTSQSSRPLTRRLISGVSPAIAFRSLRGSARCGQRASDAACGQECRYQQRNRSSPHRVSCGAGRLRASAWASAA